MMKLTRILILILIVAQCALVFPAHAQTPLVRAVLFFSPSCGHCHLVITEVLPPLWATYGGDVEMYTLQPATPEEESNPAILGLYGEQLQILYVNTTTAIGQELYGAAANKFDIAPEDRGVPLLVVSDIYLIGSTSIPEQFPGMIESGLAQGGIDWPDIAGLAEYITQLVIMPDPEDASATEGGSAPSNAQPAPEGPAASSPKPAAGTPVVPVDFNANPSFLANLQHDPIGNSLAVLILIGMTFTFVGVGVKGAMQLASSDWRRSPSSRRISTAVPILILLGILVAGYLLYIESTGTQAVCGPVGDCNTVQQSKYAMLFGFLPVGAVGLFGYLALSLAWMFSRLRAGVLSNLARLSMFGMAVIGTVFSIYLTFLEPFVIGATCAWCLTSAIVMTVLLWLTLDPALAAWVRLRKQRG